MLTILLAMAAMALRDCVATLKVVTIAKQRDVLAGLFDALEDLGNLLVAAAGAGAVILHGWTPHTLGILAGMMATSFCGTLLWVRVGRRIEGS